MKQARTSVTTACAQATRTLLLSGKEIFSDKDVRVALLKADRGSPSALIQYMGADGHLVERGFLKQVTDGYALTDSSKMTNRIAIKIAPGNAYLLDEVSKAIDGVLSRFEEVAKRQNKLPSEWDEARVQRVLAHYEGQTDEEDVAEDLEGV